MDILGAFSQRRIVDCSGACNLLKARNVDYPYQIVNIRTWPSQLTKRNATDDFPWCFFLSVFFFFFRYLLHFE